MLLLLPLLLYIAYVLYNDYRAEYRDLTITNEQLLKLVYSSTKPVA